MSPDLWDPLFRDILEGGGTNHAEAQQEHISAGVAERSQLVKLILEKWKPRWKWGQKAANVGVCELKRQALQTTVCPPDSWLKKKSSYNSIIVLLLYPISHSLTQLCISVHIVEEKYAKPFQRIHLKCLRRFHDTSFKVNNSCVCNLLQLIQNKQWSVSRQAAAITSDNEIKTHDFLSTKKLWVYLRVSWIQTWTTVVKSSRDFLPFLTFISDIVLNKFI